MSIFARAFALTLCGLMSLAVQAQSAATPVIIAPAPTGSSSVWGGAWLGLLTLTLLVVLAAVLVWLYRRGSQSHVVGGQIQLLATFAVGPRERLLVVRIQDRILALGHTPSHISLLTELDDFEPIPGAGSLTSSFAGQLQTLLSGKTRS
jgi:flagellar protein FliO/FliZ